MSNYVLRAALRYDPLWKVLVWMFGYDRVFKRAQREFFAPLYHHHNDPEEF